MSHDRQDEDLEHDSFAEAMTTVFSTETLERFLHFRLGKNLSDICSKELDLPLICVRVEQRAAKEGWRTSLIKKALKEFPQRPDFQERCNRFLAAAFSARWSGLRVNTRRRLVNLAILAAIVVVAAVWCALAPGLSGFLWLGSAISAVAAPLLGKLFEKENSLQRLADRLIGWMGANWMTWLLAVVAAGGLWASLKVGYVRFDTLPPGVTEVLINHGSHTTVLKVVDGAQRPVVISLLGESVEIRVDGYHSLNVRLHPWNRLHVDRGMFTPQIVLNVSQGEDLRDNLPGTGDNEESRQIDAWHNGAWMFATEYRAGDILLIAPQDVSSAVLPEAARVITGPWRFEPDDRLTFAVSVEQDNPKVPRYTLVVKPRQWPGPDVQEHVLRKDPE